MFKAVRDGSGRSGAVFRSHRLRRTTRLFLFEFIVVLLGVLAAQMLQGWAAKRQSRENARSAVAHLRREASQMLAISHFWQRVAPCLEAHVGNIAIAASQGRDMTAQEIGRPALPSPDVTHWDQTTFLAARSSYGEGVAQAYQDLDGQAEIIDSIDQEIAQQWAAFALLESDMGEPSAADRANVRLAAMKVRTEIRVQQIKVAETERIASNLGVHRAEWADSVGAGDLVDRCGLLKNW